MELVVNLTILFATVIGMEALAWGLHKYVLHGPLWFLHKSHHEVQKTWWEWNDLVSLSYGVISTLLIVHGLTNHSFTLWIGIGICVYGCIYFLFHDVIIHRRIKIKYHFKSLYINRLIRAHKIHHKHLGKNPSEAYGFLFATKKYDRK